MSSVIPNLHLHQTKKYVNLVAMDSCHRSISSFIEGSGYIRHTRNYDVYYQNIGTVLLSVQSCRSYTFYTIQIGLPQFIYCFLFNDGVSSSEYRPTASNVRVMGE
jgi:hypothetical protein